MKKFLDVIMYFLGLFTNICIAGLFLFLLYHYTMRGFEYGKNIIDAETSTKASKAVTVEVPEGADAMAIGGILQDAGLVSNKYVFWLQSRLNGTYKLFNAGSYNLDMAMSANEIMDTLQKEQFAESEYVTITIAEGLNVRQIGAIAESLEIFEAAEFVDACENFDGSAYTFLPDYAEGRNKLEGYLFPDTYFLPKNPKPEDLIFRMLNRFEDVLSEIKLEIDESELTTDEIIIVASMIEKEIKRDDERAVAASVIYNRLAIDMRLEIDSTIVYILNKRVDRLMEADLLVESPYSTYTNAGLPIGPICNPGRDSILAAIDPAASDYLYYVVSNEETGEHYFTNNYDDFLAAKARYLSSKTGE